MSDKKMSPGELSTRTEASVKLAEFMKWVFRDRKVDVASARDMMMHEFRRWEKRYGDRDTAAEPVPEYAHGCDGVKKFAAGNYTPGPVTDAKAGLAKELAVTEVLLEERQRVLDAIPECPVHGSCVPHALEWIKEAKQVMRPHRQREKLCPSYNTFFCDVGSLLNNVKGTPGFDDTKIDDTKITEIKPKCMNCRYFFYDDDLSLNAKVDGTVAGACRRHPKRQSRKGMDWCGEHQPDTP